MRRVLIALLISTSLLVAVAGAASAHDPCQIGCVSPDYVSVQ